MRLEVRPYQRNFRKPLRTGHGVWSQRQGWIVRISIDEARCGFGECAPLPDFGTESFRQAAQTLHAMAGQMDSLEEPLDALHSSRPACAFALSSALDQLTAKGRESGSAPASFPVAALLPAGKQAEGRLEASVAEGYQTFKWKIGVESLVEELAILRALLERLSEGQRLRLDANGGLRTSAVIRLLDLCADVGAGKVEYLEQPLRVGEEADMLRMAEESPVSLALDESLCGKSGATWLAADRWPGIFVLKPAVMGVFKQWKDKLDGARERVVVSSAFESDVGVAAALNVASVFARGGRALGFDTVGAFEDTLNTDLVGPKIGLPKDGGGRARRVWEALKTL